MESLPKPVIVESYLETAYPPPLPALRLYWDPEMTGTAERSWFLPRHLTLKGPAPERFGLSIVRVAHDSYTVRLLWNDLYLNWTALTRVQLLTSALSPLLRVLGQDLWQLLNQPVQSEAAAVHKVA
jgi:hypothetical protein